MKVCAFIFSLVCCFSYAQTDGIINLGEEVNLESVRKNLCSYDIFFFGEEHGLSNTDLAERRIIELIGSTNSRVLLEGPYERNFGLYKTFVEQDSSVYGVESFHPSKTNLFRYIHTAKLPVKAIDVVMLSQFNYFVPEIIELYKGKKYSDVVAKDLEALKNAAENYSPRADSLDMYLLITRQFEKHALEHREVIAGRYEMVEECFKALKAAVISSYEKDKLVWFLSNAREDFMFSMLKKEIDENPTKKIVSINGSYHTSLDSSIIDLNFVYKAWRPLCHKVKMAYPSKKVCSIYFLKRKKIGFFRRLRDKEFRYLFKNTRKNEMYLVPIVDTPPGFKKLKNKVNFIVVY